MTGNLAVRKRVRETRAFVPRASFRGRGLGAVRGELQASPSMTMVAYRNLRAQPKNNVIVESNAKITRMNGEGRTNAEKADIKAVLRALLEVFANRTPVCKCQFCQDLRAEAGKTTPAAPSSLD
jgi:hypothetical protein